MDRESELATLNKGHASSTVQKSDVTAESEPIGAASSVNNRGENVPPTPPALVQACQTGNFEEVQRLLRSGEAAAQDVGEDGTTALHWAAINNQVRICEYLLDQGAVVDARGGELRATPLHWACRSGLVYIVRLLLDRGADPLRTDAQGFNGLHLATLSSNVMLVIYLLHQGLPVDAVDPNGRTAAHWAAYQGDGLTIDVLCKWRTNVHAVDLLGFTPLNWAVVNGSQACMKRLIEEGSDVFRKVGDPARPLQNQNQSQYQPFDSFGGRDPVTSPSSSSPTAAGSNFRTLGQEDASRSGTTKWEAEHESRLSDSPNNNHKPNQSQNQNQDDSMLVAQGKTLFMMAQEMNTTRQWLAALDECRRLPDGQLEPKTCSDAWTQRILFYSPTLAIAVAINIAVSWPSLFPWWVSYPLALAFLYGYFKLIGKKIVPNMYRGRNAALRSPFFAGVFFGSALNTVWVYLFVLLPQTFVYAKLLNIVFTIVFASALYSFLRAKFMDPGYVPLASGGVPEQQRVIDELLDEGLYDAHHFCISTFIRKPLRSRYDKGSGRVVARFDHYCPWIDNVVGLRNHRLFVIYVLSLLVGLPLLVCIVLKLESVPEYGQKADLESCLIFPRSLCVASQVAPVTTVLALWDALQLSWIFALAFVQLVQIARGLTTAEAANLHRFGNVDGDQHFSSLPNDYNHPSRRQQLQSSLSALGPGGGHGAHGGHGHHHSHGCWSTVTRVLGVDQFVSTARDAIHARSNDQPTSRADFGAKTNCVDFWLPNRGLNIYETPEAGGHARLNNRVVNYYKLWVIPASV